MKRRSCGECPKFMNGYCMHLAKMAMQNTPSCDYGLKLMKNKYIAEWMANKRRGAK